MFKENFSSIWKEPIYVVRLDLWIKFIWLAGKAWKNRSIKKLLLFQYIFCFSWNTNSRTFLFKWIQMQNAQNRVGEFWNWTIHYKRVLLCFWCKNKLFHVPSCRAHKIYQLCHQDWPYICLFKSYGPRNLSSPGTSEGDEDQGGRWH